MSSPRVCSFMKSTVNSSSFAVISLNTIRIKTHIWAVSLTSVDSSNCSEKNSQFLMSVHICWVKSLAMASQRRVTVCLDSCRALIEDNISALFLKSRNNESAASTNASFRLGRTSCFSVLEGLLVFNNGVTHPERCFGGCLCF